MGSLAPEIALLLFAAVVFGGLVGWLIRGARSNRRIDELNREWQSRSDDVAREKDHMTAEIITMRSTTASLHDIIQSQESAIARDDSESESEPHRTPESDQTE